MMAEYKDVDLDDDPCIFPDCGHILTRSSMDGSVSMSDHYDLDENGIPIAIRSPSKPFSLDNVQFKGCPQCRGPLRNIARYGRIVRRVMLDESTKKFISWSGDRHLELAERLLQEEQRLGTTDSLSQDTSRPAQLTLTGHVPGQLSRLQKWVGKKRYSNMIRLYMDIFKYRDQVRAEEQPFQRVANFVKHANRSKATGHTAFSFDDSVIQLRGYLQATSLLLKCNISILSDFMDVWKSYTSKQGHTEVNVDFAENIAQCQELIKLATDTKRPQIEVEGHMYLAYFHAFALALVLPGTPSVDPGSIPGTFPAAHESTGPIAREALKSAGLEHVGTARALLKSHDWPARQTVETELETVENLLNGSVFYRPVTADERRAVYAAMAKEFSGTGHWYTCEEGHPFTVGECGMPMEQARCPECGSAVGGQNHLPAAGVTHATEMERLAGGFEGMEI